MQSNLGRFSFRGQFDSNGVASVTINRRAPATLLILQLVLGPAGDLNEINGTVSGGFWTADLMTARAVYDRQSNPAPQAGDYTLVLDAGPGHEPVAPIQWRGLAKTGRWLRLLRPRQSMRRGFFWPVSYAARNDTCESNRVGNDGESCVGFCRQALTRPIQSNP